MQKYGAYVPTELFGSECFMGRLMKRMPELEMCYMLGNSLGHSVPVWRAPWTSGMTGRILCQCWLPWLALNS